MHIIYEKIFRKRVEKVRFGLFYDHGRNGNLHEEAFSLDYDRPSDENRLVSKGE